MNPIKYFRSAGFAIAAIVCLAACSADPGPARLSDFAWLTGSWRGTNAEGVTIEQIWTPPSAGSMNGVHIARIGTDVRMRGEMQLVGGENGVVLLGSPEGRPPANYRLVGRGDQWIEFANPRAEPPQLIRLERRGSELLVRFTSVDVLGARRSVEQRLTRI
jgi:hypothetical protein